MSPDQFNMLGVAAIVGALAYWFYNRSPKAAPVYQQAPQPRQSANIIDAYDSAGREAAARHVDEALGKFRAKRFAQDINEALNVIERPVGDGPKP